MIMKITSLFAILLLTSQSFATSFHGSTTQPASGNLDTTTLISSEYTANGVTLGRDIMAKRVRVQLALKAANICKSLNADKYELTEVSVTTYQNGLSAGSTASGQLSCISAGEYVAIPESAL
jgi:hypothetical protein